MRTKLLILLVGLLLGWTASRLVIPVPERVFVSPHILCDEPKYLVNVPFGSNIRWTVQSGPGGSYWNMLTATWSKAPWWHAGPGKTIVDGTNSGGIRLVAQGFGKDANLAGITVTSVVVRNDPTEKVAKKGKRIKR